ncbi:ABC transporter permease [Leifsonia sp. McL0607]|uniref:ABC transporter permease n=1 Tax=Leifsonia sp. McL0607 TaxID=3415672 RepID=UPI003CED3056
MAGRLRAALGTLSAPFRRSASRDPDRFTSQDLFFEAVRGLDGHPGRLILTTIGTVLGIGSLVVTYGLAQTTNAELRKQLDPSQATHFVVAPATARDSSGESRSVATFPADAESRALRLSGVTAAGVLTEVPLGDAPVTAVPVNDPSVAQKLAPVVFSATPGLFDAIGATVESGRTFDDGHDLRHDRVAVLGKAAATSLGIGRLDRQPTVFIDSRPYTVIGVLDQTDQRTDLLDSVIIPASTAREDLQAPAGDELHVGVARGSGPLIERQIPIALSPNSPKDFDSQAARGSERAAQAQADANLAFLLLGVISLLAGALGIINVTILSVKERSGEIGLRRAIGATSRDIRSQFMVETGVIGVIGGLAGTAIGVATIVVISATQGWTPVVDGWVAVAAPVLGTVIGVIAGTYPAHRAARIEPADTLRGGV